jgi:hypothetical protein
MAITVRFKCSAVTVLAVLLSSLSVRAQAPDLALNRARTVGSISIERRTFAADHCAVVERCVRASGKRSILRFDIAVVNRGKYDLVLGNPKRAPTLYEFSACHGHYHFRDLITYDILDSRGRIIVRGAKQAFCLRDNYPYLRDAPGSRGYNCDFQGLTAGWEDVYDRSLDCQWIDVTGIRPGTYKLRAQVNRSRKLAESSYRNNIIVVSFTVPHGRW